MDELVGRINGAFSTVDWVPIHYVHRSLTERHVVALYRAADVMLVTPLRDGMNLVAKEFVTCRTDEDGVLVLSEFAGAAAEMGEALQVNPYDIETMAHVVLATRCGCPRRSDACGCARSAQRIASRDVHHWAQSFIDALGGERAAGGAPEDDAQLAARTSTALAARLRSAERLLLLLDYDGTLVPFARSPDLAAPDRAAARAARRARGQAGRARARRQRAAQGAARALARRPADRSARRARLLVADGAGSAVDRDGRRERRLEAGRPAASSTTRRPRRPGALVEEKTASLAWHYRMAEPELGAARAEELWHRLEQTLRGTAGGAAARREGHRGAPDAA